MDTLAKLFGSPNRVKILRLFLFNEITPFDSADVAERSRVEKTTVTKELKTLHAIGFLSKKQFTKETITPSRSKKNPEPRISKRKVSGYILNQKFSLLNPLKLLLIDADVIRNGDLLSRVKKTGKITLFVLSGFFLSVEDSEIDMLIVGDNVSKKKIESTIDTFEAELGKEIRYAVFSTEEFKYRVSMYDKLIRNIFDFPHEVQINNTGIDLSKI